LEWLVAQTSSATATLCACLGLAFGAGGAVMLSINPPNPSAVMLGTCCAMLPLAAVSRKAATCSPRAFKVLALMTFSAANAGLVCAPYFIADLHIRHRVQGMSTVAIKPLPMILGMRRTTYLLFVTMSLILEVATSSLTASKYGEEFGLSVYFYIVVLNIACIALSQLAHQIVFAVYDVQSRLAQERDARRALESLHRPRAHKLVQRASEQSTR